MEISGRQAGKPESQDAELPEEALSLYHNVANVGGLQIPGVKGEGVVLYFEPLTTQNLKFSGVPDGPLTRSPKG